MTKLISADGVKPLIHVSDVESIPFDTLDAVVIEQDTMLILQFDEQITTPVEPIDKLVKNMINTKPVQPGNVIVKETKPLIFYAVVHDFDSCPSWKEEWIQDALDNILRESEKRQLHTIAMPILGSVHGRFDKKQFVTMLVETLTTKSPQYLEGIHVMSLVADSK